MATLCERLIELRIERNILKKDIAFAIDISSKQYKRYEIGENEPTAGILIKLADYFDVSLDYLVGRSDIKNTGK